jgi:flagellar basal-body rod protein FlgC
MRLSSILDIAASGMSAQNIRLNTTASNLANANSVAGSSDAVYRARHPIFTTFSQQLGSAMSDGDDMEQSPGVQVAGIVQSNAQPSARFEPTNPLADEKGYVYYANINTVEEMADMISASRSFETNVEIANAAKSMLQRVLSLGQ